MLILFALLLYQIKNIGPVVGSLIFLFAGIIGTLNAIELQTAEFAITDRRIIMKWGVLRRNSFDLRLMHLETLNVEQGILGRIFDWGRIEIIGTGGTRGYTPDISDPLAFRLHAQSQSGHYPGLDSKLSSTKVESRNLRDCPFCAEPILSGASICRHCGREIGPSAPLLSEPFKLEQSKYEKPINQGRMKPPAIVQERYSRFDAIDNIDEIRTNNIFQQYQGLKHRPSSNVCISEEAFFSFLEFEGIEKARTIFYKIVQQSPNQIVFRESSLDRRATNCLQIGNIDLALDLFILNTEAFPNSAKCYAALANAHKSKGDIEKAIFHYKKALELLITDRADSEENNQTLLAHIKYELVQLTKKECQLTCPACHKINTGSAKYCIYCGAKLQQTAQK